MDDDYTSDDILSQALDILEERKLYHVDTEPVSDDPEVATSLNDDQIAQELSLTQQTYTVQTEPITDDESLDGVLDIIKYQNNDVTDTQISAIKSAIDVSDMTDPGGPCQIGFRRRLHTNDLGKFTQTSPVEVKPTIDAVPTVEVPSARFSEVTDSLLQERAKPFVPKNTIKKNNWAFNLFQRWRREFSENATNRNGEKLHIYDLLADHTKELSQYSTTELNVILPAFVVALRKEDGSEYKGESILSIMCGLQRYINSYGHSLDFFKDEDFKTLKTTIDTTMQSKCAQGIGLQRRQALVITDENEAILWNKGYLGMDTPQSLLDTVFWMMGMHFGHRGGDEHRKLSFNNFLINIDSDGRTYLQYTESVSKTFRGGLKHRNIEPPTARAYENQANPKKCPVTVFQTYQKHLSPKRNPELFYFRPLQKPKTEIWFSQNAIGHNTLEGTVKRLMKQAGIPGYFTNHSLRASTATRLFRAGVSEQLIREQTGHRSVAVEAYKRTSDVQKRSVSDILQGQPAFKISKSECSYNVHEKTSGTMNAAPETMNAAPGGYECCSWGCECCSWQYECWPCNLCQLSDSYYKSFLQTLRLVSILMLPIYFEVI